LLSGKNYETLSYAVLSKIAHIERENKTFSRSYAISTNLWRWKWKYIIHKDSVRMFSVAEESVVAA